MPAPRRPSDEPSSFSRDSGLILPARSPFETPSHSPIETAAQAYERQREQELRVRKAQLERIRKELLGDRSQSSFENLSENELFVPQSKKIPEEIQLPSAEDIFSYSLNQTEDDSHYNGFPSGGNEVLLALPQKKTALFLAQHLETTILTPDSHEQVFIGLLKAMDSETETVEGYLARNWLSPEVYLARQEGRQTYPSAFENCVNRIVDTLHYTGMQDVRSSVLLTLNKVFFAYRRHCQNFETLFPDTSYAFRLPQRTQDAAQLPVELPHTIDTCLELLESLKGSSDRTLRFQIYSLFDQMGLPSLAISEVFEAMMFHQDWKHPLGLKLYLRVQKEQPNNRLLQEILHKREILLQKLSGTNQELYENFVELLQEAQNIPFSFDPLEEGIGKIGFEIEGRFPQEGFIDRVTPERFLAQSDGANVEVKRSYKKEDHEFGPEYVNDIVKLVDWMSDNEESFRTLHIHFDYHRHTFAPLLGFLQKNVSDISRLMRTNLSTWEVWGMAVPQGVGGLHGAHLIEIIHLYQSMTKKNDERTLPLHIQTPPRDIRMATWGHACTEIGTPQGRLAALKLIQNGELHPYNPAAFFNTYDQQSWQHLSPCLRRTFEKKSNSSFTLEHLESFERISRYMTSKQKGFSQFFRPEDLKVHFEALAHTNDWDTILKLTYECTNLHQSVPLLGLLVRNKRHRDTLLQYVENDKRFTKRIDFIAALLADDSLPSEKFVEMYQAFMNSSRPKAPRSIRHSDSDEQVGDDPTSTDVPEEPPYWFSHFTAFLRPNQANHHQLLSYLWNERSRYQPTYATLLIQHAPEFVSSVDLPSLFSIFQDAVRDNGQAKPISERRKIILTLEAMLSQKTDALESILEALNQSFPSSAKNYGTLLICLEVLASQSEFGESVENTLQSIIEEQASLYFQTPTRYRPLQNMLKATPAILYDLHAQGIDCSRTLRTALKFFDEANCEELLKVACAFPEFYEDIIQEDVPSRALDVNEFIEYFFRQGSSANPKVQHVWSKFLERHPQALNEPLVKILLTRFHLTGSTWNMYKKIHE